MFVPARYSGEPKTELAFPVSTQSLQIGLVTGAKLQVRHHLVRVIEEIMRILRDRLGANPNPFLHFLRSEPLSPSTGGRLGKIRKRTLRSLQVLDPFEYLASCNRNQAGPHPGGVDEVLTTVEPTTRESTPRWLGNLGPNNEFLPQVDPVPAPQPRSLTRLIDAVRALRNRSFQTMALYEFQHFRCGDGGGWAEKEAPANSP
jgi:hypothetical protein